MKAPNLLTLAQLVPLYLEGFPDVGWHGARAEYPIRPGGRMCEADNMDYALRDLLATIIAPAPTPGPGMSDAASSPRALAALTVDELRPSDLRAVLQHMVARNLCRNQVNARKGRILRFVRWAVQYEIAHESVITRLAAVTGVKAHYPGVRTTAKITAVDQAIVEATLRVARPELRRAIEVQAITAMRPGELCMMRVCDLRPGRTPDGDPIWTYSPAQHKTAHHGVRRNIPLGPVAQTILREQVSVRFSQGDLLGGPGCGVPRLGDLEDRRRIWSWTSVSGYRVAVAKAAKRAGVEHWHPNQLRHSRITFAAHTVSESVAQAIAGHTDAATTRRHYIDQDNAGATLFAQDFG
jgi:integrase